MKKTAKAAAKINLMLDLTSVLQNGYHSIYTVMQSVGIFDTVTVDITDTKKTELTCSDPSIPVNNKNTAYKAAEYFFEFTKTENPGVKIHIDKVIPSGAGMAGGSADAAAVIRLLADIYGANLKDMYAIGEKIGADVPFCISGGTKLCLNKGEVMASLPDLKNCFFVIVKPEQSVSTKEAYTAYDNASYIRHPDRDGFLFAASQGDLDTMCMKAANVFEQVVEVSDRVTIKSVMRDYGAKLALMTGSGSTIFGIFTDKDSAVNCRSELSKKFKNSFFAEPTEKAIFTD